ncbi:MAG: hypothetical protein M4579_002022 [Chaenotheca gracillima]|nr:MAG: hypothetical protein M4579_002022 [Chaenotheca gracillima]
MAPFSELPTADQPRGTVILTGANGGLGASFVTKFLASPHAQGNLLLGTVRDPARHPELEAELRQSNGRGRLVALDLGTLEATRAFAASIIAQVQAGTLPPIRLLVLNAAVQDNFGQHFTSDGFERTFAVNYLASFVLVLLLLPVFAKDGGRVVFVGSFVHDPALRINANFKPPKEAFTEEGIERWARPKADAKGDEWNSGMRRYGASKLAGLMLMYELQRRLTAGGSSVSLLTVDPGGMPTTTMASNQANMLTSFVVKYVLGYLIMPIMMAFNSRNSFLRSTSKSARDLLYAGFDTKTFGTHPEAVTLDGCVLNVTSEESRDEAKQGRLWRESVRLAGVRREETIVELG